MFSSILTRKHNPNHDAKGRFSSSSSGISGDSRNHLREMFDRVSQPDGGFTYQPTTEKEPTEGYALSIYPEKSFAKPVAEFKLKDLVSYYIQNKAMFSQPDHFIGAWHDPASHNIFLDVSVVKSSEEEATKLALAHDQIAYFDLKNFKSVTVNPDAKSGVLKNGQTGIALAETGRGFGTCFYRSDVQEADGAGADAGRVGRSQADAGATVAQLIAKDDLSQADLDVAGRKSPESIRAKRRKVKFMDIATVLKGNPNHDPKTGEFSTGTGGPSESADRSGAGGAEGSGVSLRPQKPDALSASVTHYSTQGGLTSLSAAHYGTGLRGAEGARLSQSNDSNIKHRVYFYLNPADGKLPRKESGLGPHVYQVKLSNLYDFSKDPANIRERSKAISDPAEKANFMESEIVKAGYDGYTNKIYNMAVVLGKDVPVQYKGTDAKKGEFAAVFKFNPNHDPKNGQFSSVDSERLGALLKEMAHGAVHPNIMRLKVDGKMPFGGHDNLGIKRIDMPQIPRSEREQFVTNLHANVSVDSVDPMTLKPTQDELDGMKVGALYHKLEKGDKATDPILVSEDNYIIDGHHHWGAAIAAKVTGLDPHHKIAIYKVHMPHGALLAAAHKYADEHGYASKDITKAEFSFAQVLKHNPYHDNLGRFATGNGATFISLWGKGYAKALQTANQQEDPNEGLPTKSFGPILGDRSAGVVQEPAQSVASAAPKMTQEEAQAYLKASVWKVLDAAAHVKTENSSSSTLTEKEKALKEQFTNYLEAGKIAYPDKPDLEKILSKKLHMVPDAIKQKLGIYVEPKPKDDTDALAKALYGDDSDKVGQQYQALAKYQQAKEKQYMAAMTGTGDADAWAIEALNHKQDAKKLGAPDDVYSYYDTQAKDNAAYNFKMGKAKATEDLKKNIQQFHEFVRAGKNLDQSNLDSANKPIVDKGFLKPEEVAQLLADGKNKAGALSRYHKELKAMVPEGEKMSKKFDTEDFKSIPPGSLEESKFFMEESKKFDGLNYQTQSALKNYTTSGYKQNKNIGLAVTAKIMGGTPPTFTSSDKSYIKSMDEATSQTLDHNLKLRRNFPTIYMMEQMGYTHKDVLNMTEEARNKAFVGKVYHDTTYGSTSTNKNFSGGFSSAMQKGEGTMFIRAPKGTKGIGMDAVSENPGESEIILQRGTTYIIRSVKKNGSTLVFDADIIGQHPDKLD